MKLIIKDRVDRLKISKTKLAQQLNISYPTMLDMYNGKTTSIKLDTLEKLCQILRCQPNDILICDEPHATVMSTPSIYVSYTNEDGEYSKYIRQELEKIFPKEKLQHFGVSLQTNEAGEMVAVPYIRVAEFEKAKSPKHRHKKDDTE